MRSFVIITILLSCLSGNISATHLRSGEIQVRRTDCSSLTVEITLVIYVNTINTGISVGGENSLLFFGDGSPAFIVPETPVTAIIDSDLGIGKTIIKVTHTYPSAGRYLIHFEEPNRNDGVVNIESSVITPFQIESMITIENGVCNTYPILLNPPLDRGCLQSTFYYNPGGFDADGDSLSYEMAIPKKGNASPVTNYKDPNDPSFYSNYATGNEAGTGKPTFQIDATTGLLTWDAPGKAGEYTIAIKVREWKKDGNGNWNEVSYVVRDMQIIVQDCENRRPQLQAISELCVVAGESINVQLTGTDPDRDPIKFEVFSELLQDQNYHPVLSPAEHLEKFIPSPADLYFSMQTTCAMVRNNPYLLNIKVSDFASSTRLSTYYTIRIFIIAPPPEIRSVTVNPVLKEVSLQWALPSCDNVQSYQVWRRVSSQQYDEPACATGMPLSLRYDLIATVSPLEETFTDTNVDIGSQYCYRIVALVNGDIESKLSVDTCLIPKPAEAPVITNVSVEKTSFSEGKIFVRWTSPFDIDKTQYPPPYQYQVYRKEDRPESQYQAVGGLQSDTTLTDVLLNTQENIYSYYIRLFVPALANFPIDSSSQASSVAATAVSQVEQINLQWSAHVPWSNYSERHPYHLIYRSIDSEGPFELIDSVHVIKDGFKYEDRGSYKNQGLANDMYFYKIKTRGTYGNPSIREPLENFSPTIPGRLLDTIPPCTPLAEIEQINCNRFSCDGKSYYTSLKWRMGEPICDEDIAAYEVYIKYDTAKTFELTTIESQPKYIHGNLSNLDYCYRVVAIDRAGNRSDSSATVCNSSCTKFKVPNVITPGDDAKNDYFTMYDAENSTVDDCARSVTRVELKVFNRWGTEIYLTKIDNMETKVFWEGIDKNGNHVSAGTYFYQASIDFNTRDESKKKKEVKGWVQVVR